MKLQQELRRREDRQVRADAKEVFVAGDEERSSAEGRREEVVIIGIGGAHRGWLRRVVGDSSLASYPADVSRGLFRRDAPSDLGVRECASEFGDEQLGDNQLEPTVARA